MKDLSDRGAVDLDERHDPAYPPTGTYDECTIVEDRSRALKTIPKVPPPRKDPVYGTGGPLPKLWKKAK